VLEAGHAQPTPTDLHNALQSQPLPQYQSRGLVQRYALGDLTAQQAAAQVAHCLWHRQWPLPPCHRLGPDLHPV